MGLLVCYRLSHVFKVLQRLDSYLSSNQIREKLWFTQLHFIYDENVDLFFFI